MAGYPDSHLNPAPGRGPSPRVQAVFVAIPIVLAAAWLIYFWSITGVHTVVEKYPNGQVRAEGYARRSGVENYKRHGHWVTYHENGQKESEGFYERGEKTGTWSYWDSTGKPTTTAPAASTSDQRAPRASTGPIFRNSAPFSGLSRKTTMPVLSQVEFTTKQCAFGVSG